MLDSSESCCSVLALLREAKEEKRGSSSAKENNRGHFINKLIIPVRYMKIVWHKFLQI